MEEKEHGGKRLGAGRKPVFNKKKQVTLYVETRLIFPFVTEEKMKVKIYEFISGYGSKQLEGNIQYVKPTPANYDSPRISNMLNDEAGMWPTPKELGSIQDEPLSFDKLRKEIAPQMTGKPPKTFEQYMIWKRECENPDQWRELLKDLDANPTLNKKQKDIVKTANPSQL